MTPVLAAIGRHADGVLELLRSWSEAGYAATFIWAGSDGSYRLVQNGNVRACSFGEALDGRSLNAFVVGVVLPCAEGAIRGDDLLQVERVQGALEAAVPGAEVSSPTVVFFPFDATTTIAPPRGGVFRTAFVVVPEDQSGPHAANTFDPLDDEQVIAHVAHAVACLTGILGGPDGALLQPRLDELPHAMGVPVSFVRCHSRLIDAGFLLDALTAKAFTSDRTGWPNPDRSRFDRGGLPADSTDALVADYLNRHEDVFGLRAVEALRTPEPHRLSLLAALRAVCRFWITELKRRPYEWFDDRLERLWDGVVVTTVERLGRAGDVRVVPWRERPSDEQISRFIAAELAKPVPAPDGPVGPAWRELAALTIGLIDGRELPVGAAARGREERRQLETRPSRVVPDPLDLPPFELRPVRACDPAKLDPLILSLLGSPQVEPSLDEDTVHEADGANGGDDFAKSDPLGGDASGAARQALDEERRQRIHAWYVERSPTLLWRMGQQLAGRIEQAAKESEGPGEDDWEHLEKSIADNRALGQKRSRRRRRWFVARTLLATGVAAWLIVGHLPTVLKPVGVLLVGLVWIALLIGSWWKSHSWTSRRETDTHRDTEDLLHRAIVAATRRGDHERLRRRYAEYLDWAEVLGHVVHRPWVPRATPYGRREDFQAPPDAEALPAACKLAYAILPEARLRKISAQAESSVFHVGWLTDLVDETIEKASRDWVELHPPRGKDMTVIPDPYSDLSSDPDNLRTHVLRWVRLGYGRSIAESRLAGEYAERVGRERASTVLAELVDAAASDEVPLPPAAQWFSSPDGIERLSTQVRELVVGITALTDAGSSWRGTGVLVGNLGLVATCRHCVEIAGRVKFGVATVDGSTFEAELVATAKDADVALLRATTEVSLPAAEIGAADDLVQGSPIFTLGYPFFSHETGGPTLAWGAVTAVRREIQGDRGTPETRVQTNYPAGGGASGSPVFNTNCELIGIHAGGYSEPGAEERSAHVSFAVPIERVVELMADSDMAAPVDLSAEPGIPVGIGGAETFTLAAFLEPLLDSSETFLGAHGALTTTARRCGIASVAPAELARAELVEASLAEIARQPIGVGTAVRVIATRIDQTDAFDVGQHVNVRERIPWFVVPSEAVAPIAFAEGAVEEGLGSI